MWATIIAYTFIFILFPYCSDDLTYMSHVSDYFISGSTDNLWHDWWKGRMWRYNYDNFRLGNTIYTLFLFLPKWIGAVVTGIAFALTLRFILKVGLLGKGGKCNWMYVVWVCFSITFFLPWNDQLFITCFLFNYIWTSAIFCGLTLWFLTVPKQKISWPKALALFLFGLIAGSWHEGFSLPMLCSIASVMLLWPKKFLDAQHLIVSVGVAVGMILIICVPGTTNRTQIVHWFQYFLPHTRVHIIDFLYLLSLVMALFSRRSRKFVTSPITVLLLVNIAVAIFMHFALGFAPRIGFWANVCSIMGLLYICHNCLNKSRRWINFTSIVVSAIMCAVLFVHLGAVCYVTTILRKQTYELYRMAWNNPRKPIFYDVLRSEDAPWIVMERPYFNIFTNSYNLICLNVLRGEDLGLAPVPMALRQAHSDSLTQINGHWYMPAPDSIAVGNISEKDGAVQINSGRWVPRKVLKICFISPADNRKYYYLYPQYVFFRSFGRPVTGVRVDD